MESYRKLLFDNPGYHFTNVTKFLSEGNLDHNYALGQLVRIEENIKAFAVAIKKVEVDCTRIEGLLSDLMYPLIRTENYLKTTAGSGLTDRDACVFVLYMMYCYEEMASLVESLDEDLKG